MDISQVRRVEFGTTTNPHLHIDQLLTNVVIAYRPQGMIVDRIAPVVPVGKQSDLYLVYDRADTVRTTTNMSVRAPGTEANKVSRAVGSGNYFCRNYALKIPVTIEDRVNADPAFLQHHLNAHGMFLTDLLMLEWEARVANLITTVANVGSGAGVASAWNTDNGNPIGDLNTAINNVHYSTGYRPNRIVMGVKAWNSLRTHADIRNLIFGVNNGGGFANTQQVANLFDVEEVLVSNAFNNTANEAQAEALNSPWADHVVVYYAPSAPSIMVPSFMYSFRWTDARLANMQVERHPYDSKIKAEEIEVGYYQDEKITAPTYAYVIRAVNSST
ncbi:MAG TPA: major capsid protein [Steroidobacteraceae bacterium]